MRCGKPYIAPVAPRLAPRGAYTAWCSRSGAILTGKMASCLMRVGACPLARTNPGLRVLRCYTRFQPRVTCQDLQRRHGLHTRSNNTIPNRRMVASTFTYHEYDHEGERRAKPAMLSSSMILGLQGASAN